MAAADSLGEITAGLSQPVLNFAFFGAFRMSSKAGKSAPKLGSSRESLLEGRSWADWGLHLVPQTDLESSSEGIRSSSCKLKLEKFKWEINYRFLIRRTITFPRDVVDSPPFKSFNTGEESFSKKTPLQFDRRVISSDARAADATAWAGQAGAGGRGDLPGVL